MKALGVHVVILIVVSFQVLIHPIIYLEYQIRKDFIIKNICVEREYKINSCQGKCHVIKLFDLASQKDRAQKEKEIKPLEINFYLSTIQDLLKKKCGLNYTKHAIMEQVSYKYLLLSTVFKPPRT